ncbi:ferredoxin [Candidatus Fermentibacteria bacterium]|nr:ferredoxin [Candidatus Fermentibacteria bacterium]
MRAKVLPTKCESIGVCVMICPDVFRLQPGSKKAAVVANPVPEIYESACRKAAESVPREAIVIYEE